MPTGSKPGGASRRTRASVHLHQPLIAEQNLLIGRQDQRFISGNEMRLGRDVPFSIEEELLQTLTCAADQLHGDDADRALPMGRQRSDKRE